MSGVIWMGLQLKILFTKMIYMNYHFTSMVQRQMSGHSIGVQMHEERALQAAANHFTVLFVQEVVFSRCQFISSKLLQIRALKETEKLGIRYLAQLLSRLAIWRIWL